MITQNRGVINSLKCFTHYPSAIQKELRILGVKQQASFYIYLQQRNGLLHLLNPGDIENINGCHPQKADIKYGLHGSYPLLQSCGWDQVWVEENDIVKSLSQDSGVQTINPSNPDITETEGTTLLKLFFGLAIHGYGYNPSAKTNKSAGEKNGSIYVALKSVGLDASSDTIRKYLNLGKEKFPSAKPNKS